MNIRALPVALSNLAFDRPFVKPGAFVQAAYATSGATAISAAIADAAGRTVTTLASALDVDAGAHTLSWDGRDNAANPLADGIYSLRVTSQDPSGLTGRASTSITVDSSAPKITITSPSVIGPQQAISAQLDDPLSGVVSGSVEAPSSFEKLATIDAGQRSVAVGPPPGDRWRAGTHDVVIVVTDRAGNTSRKTVHFRVSSQAATVSGQSALCNALAAEHAILGSPSAVRTLRPLLGGARLFDRYANRTVVCRDFNADGHGDMAVLLRRSVSGARTPLLLFTGNGRGHWTHRFSVTSRAISRLRASGRQLRITAGPRTLTVVFARGRFALRR